MLDLQRAELAMSEILTFEVAIERFFGFSSSSMASAGVAVDSSVGAGRASASLSASGLSVAAISGRGVGSSVLQAQGEAVAAFTGVAIQKISATFSMAGTCNWYARGVNFRPAMRMSDGFVSRSAEQRSMRRGAEYRSMKVAAAPQEHRFEERRKAKR